MTIPPLSSSEDESARSQMCGEASADAEVFAGLDPAVSAAMDASFWKAEWHKLDAIRDDLLEALQETWRVLREAGTLNLSNGVQLGPTAWYVKISDAEELSDAALAKATSLPVQPPVTSHKLNAAQLVFLRELAAFLVRSDHTFDRQRGASLHLLISAHERRSRS